MTAEHETTPLDRPAHEGLALEDAGSQSCVPLQEFHKDFYLRHPLHMSAEFCWGNLEAAHPVLGRRGDEEVEKYRRDNGIQVCAFRGRAPPKPFQAFSETSFPDFVEELAYELFTTDAVPFPVQAQAWPCVLAGMDLVAVAPTGSGKTLAFLLPALVHTMAQDVLKKSEGPIAVVLSPSRELAQQTSAVAEHFFNRTEGDDRLRASAVFGGADVRSQLPQKGAPDFGRWPELLVATPGRLLELLHRRLIDPCRITYVVLDEADLLLSHGWFTLVRNILAYMRVDRQLLFLSATWPQEADAIASDLCGEELVKIRVDPPVPKIPQSVVLFPQAEESVACRQAALEEWVREDLRHDESLLLFCTKPETVRHLATSQSLSAALGGTTRIDRRNVLSRGGAANGGCVSDVVATLCDGMPTRHRAEEYWRFIEGKARALITTFRIGSRGLDFSDTTASAVDRGLLGGDGDGNADDDGDQIRAAASPLSVVIILFDFPPTIQDYAHCIGRTKRPGQRGGRVVAFLPEMRFWIARELVSLMEQCEQQVPSALSDLVAQDQAFLDGCRAAMQGLKDGKGEVDEGLFHGEFDGDHGVWSLPASMPSYRRKLLHMLADEFGLPHVSTGDRNSGERRLHVALQREQLPDCFFWEGEEVEVVRQDSSRMHGVVIDSRLHPQYRTIMVQIEDGCNIKVPVDRVRLRPQLAIANESASLTADAKIPKP
eukprot:TRINITY_DN43231_c0_g1_i1.p1 TRINITY_DN43231_c0_g1~~TRINITY_DN43231_c0_g1_i1.p1  ORF type:complete len:734 (+),score=116.46 TRINITY_DN43231_c0_g1_i1:62-2203(+)